MHTGELTKERLMDEATKLVQQRGFGAVSVNDLLLAAGVKKGTLYYHFPGKDDLGLALLERAKTSFLAWLDEAFSSATPLDGLHKFFSLVLERHRRRGFVGGCLFGNTVLEMSDTSPRYTESMRNLFQIWCEKIAAVILAGQQAGQIRTDLPACDLAQVLVANIEGGIMLSRLKKDEMPLKTCLDSLSVFIRYEPLKVSGVQP